MQRKRQARWLLAVAAVPGLVLFAVTAVELVAAGIHADSTATITPSSEGLWVRTVVSIAIILASAVGMGCVQLRPQHAGLAIASSLLLSASLSFLAFDVYWWFAAGSYADMALKQIPPSGWKTYPVMGTSAVATVFFGFSTALLMMQGRTTSRVPSPA